MGVCNPLIPIGNPQVAVIEEIDTPRPPLHTIVYYRGVGYYRLTTGVSNVLNKNNSYTYLLTYTDRMY